MFMLLFVCSKPDMTNWMGRSRPYLFLAITEERYYMHLYLRTCVRTYKGIHRRHLQLGTALDQRKPRCRVTS